MSTLRGSVAAAFALAALGACSRSSQTPEDHSPTRAPAAGYGPATQPGAGKIELDITANAGRAVYGDPAAGKQVFNQCISCHSREPGVNNVGPSLHGVIGRPAGSVPGFNYSPANKGSGLVWTEQELYTYLENPRKTVPGTYMTFTGVKDPRKRADLIAFLQVSTK